WTDRKRRALLRADGSALHGEAQASPALARPVRTWIARALAGDLGTAVHARTRVIAAIGVGAVLIGVTSARTAAGRRALASQAERRGALGSVHAVRAVGEEARRARVGSGRRSRVLGAKVEHAADAALAHLAGGTVVGRAADPRGRFGVAALPALTDGRG